MTIQALFDLTGKVAGVIGGARDFGFYMGEVLAEAGWDLVITSPTLASVRRAAEKLRVVTVVGRLPARLRWRFSPLGSRIKLRLAKPQSHFCSACRASG